MKKERTTQRKKKPFKEHTNKQTTNLKRLKETKQKEDINKE